MKIDGKDASGAEILTYFLTTSFRDDPDPAKGEKRSRLNFGPLVDVSQIRIKDTDHNGLPEIVDSWDQPLHYLRLDNKRDKHGYKRELYSLGEPGKTKPIKP